uniref:V-ATPase 14 kDa subunit n=1 Tax=Acanthochromis polyacanthus TaxID=80966 RepID=A0A3Q1GVQ2_9TELE
MVLYWLSYGFVLGFRPGCLNLNGLWLIDLCVCRSFLARNDIGIILINQFIAEMIRHAIDAHMQSIPAVLEIPSKEHPYDASKDSILRRAKGMFSAEDFR